MRDDEKTKMMQELAELGVSFEEMEDLFELEEVVGEEGVEQVAKELIFGKPEPLHEEDKR